MGSSIELNITVEIFKAFHHPSLFLSQVPSSAHEILYVKEEEYL